MISNTTATDMLITSFVEISFFDRMLIGVPVVLLLRHLLRLLDGICTWA